MRPLLLLLLLLFPGFDALAQQTASQRLERLAAEAQERAFDLFPFGETMGKGPGPRQDKLVIASRQENGKRERAHSRWRAQRQQRVGELLRSIEEKLTHALLAQRSRDSLDRFRREREIVMPAAAPSR